jgi:predicted nucleotidyltransferase
MIDLSSSIEPRLAVAGEVLSLVSAVAEQHGVELMVVGATARDLLSAAIVGTPPARATADVDVAVAVPSWQGFEDLTSGLQRAGTAKHTFLVSGVEVDVVPFGDVETPDRRIDWGDGTLMNAVGLTETFARSERVRLPGGTEVRAPTVPGLAVLKLMAWSDRRLATKRDAVDLQTIMGWYGAGVLLDELYDSEPALLEQHDFDPDPAAAHRLGRHMAELLGASTGLVLAMLTDDHVAKLAADMPASVVNRSATLRALREGMRLTRPS